MKQKKINKKGVSNDKWIQKHIDQKSIVKFYRKTTTGEADISCFILNQSNHFLLLQVNEEFVLNGYAIIRKKHFEAMRCNAFDKTSKRILLEEGITQKEYGIHFEVPLTTWEDIFNKLFILDQHVIIECEKVKDPTFDIGPIVKVTPKSVLIRYYDPTGRLEDNLTEIKYKNITLVKFGDRYSMTFRKYLRSPKRSLAS